MGENVSPDSVNITFTWKQKVPQYGDKLLQRLDGFRKKNMFYDVTLKTIDQDLAAHKVVLAACGGMFRSHFIDRQTKKILSHVEEVSFDCSSAGLHTILKFAYSGVLEISEENLLATYQASLATEMKEVQQICVDLAISRLDWILKFDGSENTIPSVTSNGTASDSEEVKQPLSIEDTYQLLHKLIKLNASTFGARKTVRDESGDNIKADINDSKIYPCLCEVENRWPGLKLVYIAMVDCLQQIRRIKYPEGNKTAGNMKHAQENSSTNAQPTKPDVQPTKPNVQPTKPNVQPTKPNVQPTKPNVQPTKPDVQPTKPDVQPTKPDDVQTSADEVKNVVQIKNESSPSKSIEVSSLNSSKDDIRESPAVQTVSSTSNEIKPPTKASSVENITKPVTKPRLTSVTQHTRSLSGGTHHTRNLSGSKQEFLPSTESSTRSPGTAPKTTTKPVSHTPRKKHAAPKPPGPPPGSASKVVSQPKPANPASNDCAKHPPPRPKPPSVKRLTEPKIESAEPPNYDDSLNPFADDDEEASEPTNDYDNSLNPFG